MCGKIRGCWRNLTLTGLGRNYEALVIYDKTLLHPQPATNFYLSSLSPI